MQQRLRRARTIPRNIDDVATLDPNSFFNHTFAYFAVIIDALLVGMFVASVVLAIIAFYFRKFGSFRHPAFWLLVASHLPYLFVERIGNSPAIRSVLAEIFK